MKVFEFQRNCVSVPVKGAKLWLSSLLILKKYCICMLVFLSVVENIVVLCPYLLLFSPTRS